MRRTLAWTLAIVFLSSAGVSADDSCEVRVRQIGAKSVRVVHCDEDPATIDAAIDRAQASCDELPGETRLECLDAIAASFALRHQSMIRRALREGGTSEAVADHYGASVEEVEQIRAEMAPPERTIDAEAEASRAAARELAERDFLELMAREGLD
jgi:hypothetical protein